tara:strand:- start:6927 stop:8207 length:1281 start_codon:yes stop_codon:yes gene_type:complete
MLDHQELNKNFNKDHVIIIALFIGSPTLEHDYEIEELERLVNTLGGTVVDKIVQYRKNIDPKFYIGKGKLNDIFKYAIDKKCQYIVINNDISPGQIKNIQSYFGDKILIKDRVGIILDIFNKHARTKEAKTQIKLAQMEYFLPRLTRQWTHLERQMGGVGTRGGPGETQIEIDRRLIRNQIIKLKKELVKISNNRKVQKKNRNDIFKVSLIGYTNAGKSTIMKKISQKDTYIKDELFATLDTNTRRINIEKNKSFILSDTVGFIRNLPDNLIASFRSTLGEVIDSDLLLKVIDVSSPEYNMHLESIDSVLNYLKVNNKEYFIIFNKIDLISDEKLIKNLKSLYPNSLFISAYQNINTNHILKFIKRKINQQNITKTIRISYNQGKIINDIYNRCEILDQNDYDGYIEFKVSATEKNINSIIRQIKK